MILSVIFVEHAKLQAKPYRGVIQASNSLKWDDHRAGLAAKKQGDAEMILGNPQIGILVLDYNGHLIRMFRAQTLIDFDTFIVSDKAYIEMCLTGQSDIFDDAQ